MPREQDGPSIAQQVLSQNDSPDLMQMLSQLVGMNSQLQGDQRQQALLPGVLADQQAGTTSARLRNKRDRFDLSRAPKLARQEDRAKKFSFKGAASELKTDKLNRQVTRNAQDLHPLEKRKLENEVNLGGQAVKGGNLGLNAQPAMTMLELQRLLEQVKQLQIMNGLNSGIMGSGAPVPNPNMDLIEGLQ